MSMNKKGVELTLNVIIVGIIVLVVLILLIYLLLHNSGKFSQGSSCFDAGGSCRAVSAGDNTCNPPITAGRDGKPLQQGYCPNNEYCCPLVPGT